MGPYVEENTGLVVFLVVMIGWFRLTQEQADTKDRYETGEMDRPNPHAYRTRGKRKEVFPPPPPFPILACGLQALSCSPSPSPASWRSLDTPVAGNPPQRRLAAVRARPEGPEGEPRRARLPRRLAEVFRPWLTPKTLHQPAPGEGPAGRNGVCPRRGWGDHPPHKHLQFGRILSFSLPSRPGRWLWQAAPRRPGLLPPSRPLSPARARGTRLPLPRVPPPTRLCPQDRPSCRARAPAACWAAEQAAGPHPARVRRC